MPGPSSQDRAVFLAPSRWRLAAGPGLAPRLGALLRACPADAAVWVASAERLRAGDAATLRATLAGRRQLVLEVAAPLLPRLALARLVAAGGADAVLIVAAAADVEAITAVAAATAAARDVPVGLALRSVAGTAALAPWLAAAATLPGHVEVEPLAPDADAAGRTEPTGGWPPGWRLAPGGHGHRPTSAAPAAPRRLAPTPGMPRWSDAAEWIALELGLRRVWRADLDPAQAEDLAHAAAAAGLRWRRGAAVDIDAAGLWRPDPRGRVLLYVGAHDADLARADALERATLALRIGDARAAAALGVDPAADHDAEMGALLGYPPCCVAAFVRGHQAWTAAHSAEVAEVAFYALAAAGATRGSFDARLDFVSPLSGATPLRHYPCAFDCASSIALAAAIDARAWAKDPTRRARDEAARADAVLFFASGAALPLRGRIGEDGAVMEPTPLLGGRVSWAPHLAALREGIAPAVAAAKALRPLHGWDGAGGILAADGDGCWARLPWLGGFPGLVNVEMFPRVLVFGAGAGGGGVLAGAGC